MNEALVANWNSVVGPYDKVYHLGDVLFGKKTGVVDRLHGKIYLVAGNHDDLGNFEFTKRFTEIYSLFYNKKRGVVMSHSPIHESQIERGCTVNLHGHLHDKHVMSYVRGHKNGVTEVRDSRYFNCCVENHDYAPFSLDELKI